MAVFGAFSQYTSLLPATLVAGVAYIVGGIIYRIFFSPIAKFPGPKIAAATWWYEFYYDAILSGQYVYEVKKMHEQYGPIVRINPEELHVETPDFYEELYSGGNKKRNKTYQYKWQFGVPESMISAIDHDLHRMRRGALNPFFSKASVRRLQPVIQERVDMLLARLKDFATSGQPMPIGLAYCAFTNDVVMEYAFARSDHRLEHETFDSTFHETMVAASFMSPWTKHMPWMLQLVQAIPEWLAKRVDAGMATFVKFERDIVTQVQQIKDGSNKNHYKVSHRTIFHDLLSSTLPASEKSVARLGQEGQVVVGAGTETTAWTLSVTTFHLLSNPAILHQLRKELIAAIPDPSQPVPLATLEQLPYLTACIQEGLRLSYGVCSRLARVSPTEALHFRVPGKLSSTTPQDWIIPPSTPVSMNSVLVHQNPSIFPSPQSYDPTRWLSSPNQRLDHYLVPFSKGSRQCLGINLAYAELYLVLAGIFRRYGGVVDRTGETEGGGRGGSESEIKRNEDEDIQGTLALFETELDDVEFGADLFTPLAKKKGSKGVRIIVTGRSPQ